MTGLLDGLDADKMIVREHQEEDRRKISVRLTLKGRQVLEQMLPDYYRRTSKVMASLDDDERRQLVSLLEKVSGGLPALTAG